MHAFARRCDGLSPKTVFEPVVDTAVCRFVPAGWMGHLMWRQRNMRSRYVLLLTLGMFAMSAVPALAQGPQPTGTIPARSGFWFNAGLGYGSLGCDDCTGREGGGSGGLSLGGTITDRFLLGVGTTGWTKEEFGERLTVGTLDLRMRFYPVRTSGFFLTAGIGVGTVTFADETESGAGVVIGVGWDVRLSRNVSLTPFYSGFAVRNDNVDANVGQIGLGITVH